MQSLVSHMRLSACPNLFYKLICSKILLLLFIIYLIIVFKQNKKKMFKKIFKSNSLKPNTFKIIYLKKLNRKLHERKKFGEFEAIIF